MSHIFYLPLKLWSHTIRVLIDADAIKNTIIIDAPENALGIIEEHRYIEKIYGEKDKEWTMIEQRLIEANQKAYDKFLITAAEGFEKKYISK